MTRRRTFRRDARGSATVEFALASLFLFGIIMVGLDFGIYAQQNLRLTNAVEQGAVIAFNSRAGTVDTTAISSYVAASAGGSTAVSYQCNGGGCATNLTPKCIGTPGVNGWPVFVDPANSGGTLSCASGAAPGTYMVIRATRTYQPVVVPDRYLNGSTMRQQAVVRLS